MKCDRARGAMSFGLGGEDPGCGLAPRGVLAAVPRAAALRWRRLGVAAVLAQLAAAVLIVVAVLGALAPAARADGDPGSDVLVNQDLFLAADAGVRVPQQVQLGNLLRSANRSGLAIRVAIITGPDDLGAVAALWRKPAAMPISRLKAARLDNTTEAEHRRLAAVNLLIIDDLALTPLDETATTDFYELTVARHRHNATIVTSNRTPDEWLGLMHDQLLAQSAVDRLTSTCHELVIEGDSYRKRQRPSRPPA